MSEKKEGGGIANGPSAYNCVSCSNDKTICCKVACNSIRDVDGPVRSGYWPNGPNPVRIPVRTGTGQVRPGPVRTGPFRTGLERKITAAKHKIIT